MAEVQTEVCHKAGSRNGCRKSFKLMANGCHRDVPWKGPKQPKEKKRDRTTDSGIKQSPAQACQELSSPCCRSSLCSYFNPPRPLAVGNTTWCHPWNCPVLTCVPPNGTPAPFLRPQDQCTLLLRTSENGALLETAALAEPHSGAHRRPAVLQ